MAERDVLPSRLREGLGEGLSALPAARPGADLPSPDPSRERKGRDVVFPAGRQELYERNRYSPAVKANGLLFVSGQVGSREDGSPEPEPEAQIRRAFDNLLAILDAAGCTFDDVQDVTMFAVDPEALFPTIMKVLPDYWGDAPHPTLTAVGVTWLYGFQFEIKVVAKLPESAA